MPPACPADVSLASPNNEAPHGSSQGPAGRNSGCTWGPRTQGWACAPHWLPRNSQCFRHSFHRKTVGLPEAWGARLGRTPGEHAWGGRLGSTPGAPPRAGVLGTRRAAVVSARGLLSRNCWLAQSGLQVTGALSTGVPEPAGPQKGDPWKDPLPTEEKRVSSDWTATGKRVKSERSLTPHTEINSKWIKDLNVRLDTVKLRGEQEKHRHKPQQHFL